ncbi:hypothetical protein CYMTET_4869 [Cymbomonas tetramitiformis]|uniref:Uncharacterized protein n=1 Tax=Cymbomonas tetramitiformis TaxID=36881 RepID=A0AAE0H0K0_9CHLO|nr:hypothetical protein CYMTET_4869 [Cymbomonas tetramitiformis]
MICKFTGLVIFLTLCASGSAYDDGSSLKMQYEDLKLSALKFQQRGFSADKRDADRIKQFAEFSKKDFEPIEQTALWQLAANMGADQELSAMLVQIPGITLQERVATLYRAGGFLLFTIICFFGIRSFGITTCMVQATLQACCLTALCQYIGFFVLLSPVVRVACEVTWYLESAPELVMLMFSGMMVMHFVVTLLLRFRSIVGPVEGLRGWLALGVCGGPEGAGPAACAGAVRHRFCGKSDRLVGAGPVESRIRRVEDQVRNLSQSLQKREYWMHHYNEEDE